MPPWLVVDVVASATNSMPMPTAFDLPEVGREVALFTHYAVKEDTVAYTVCVDGVRFSHVAEGQRHQREDVTGGAFGCLRRIRASRADRRHRCAIAPRRTASRTVVSERSRTASHKRCRECTARGRIGCRAAAPAQRLGHAKSPPIGDVAKPAIAESLSALMANVLISPQQLPMSIDGRSPIAGMLRAGPAQWRRLAIRREPLYTVQQTFGAYGACAAENVLGVLFWCSGRWC